MRRAGSLSLAAALLGLAACADLPPIESGICGNQVLDVGEDCDGHAIEPGASCAPPDAPHACRYVCSPRLFCPTGFGCGEDGVCRAPSGSFVKLDDEVPYAPFGDLRVLDYDRDNKLDALLLGPADSLGRRPARLIYPSRGLYESAVDTLPMSLAAPALGNVEAPLDETSLAKPERAKHDIAFADQRGIALFHGGESQSIQFKEFPALIGAKGAAQRAIPVDVVPNTPGDEIVHFVGDPLEKSALVRLPGALPGAVLTELPGDEERLAGPIRVGRLDEASNCDTIALAFAGASEVLTFSPCRKVAEGTAWNEGGELLHLALPAGAKVDRGLFLADVDLDTHLDIVIDAAPGALVAWGVGDGTFISAKPTGATNAASALVLPSLADRDGAAPLAIADLNGDAFADYVMPFGLVVSAPGKYVFAYENLGRPWDAALIGDFNGNARLDVAAGSSEAINIDFLNNAGGSTFNHASLPTAGPVGHFVMGDFDGDLLTDLAFAEELTLENEVSDALLVAFGAPYGPPAEIAEVCRLGEIEALTPAHFVDESSPDAITDIVATSENEETGTESIFQVEGASSRVMFAPFALRDESGEVALPIALGLGAFFDPTADIAALGVDKSTGALKLWAMEAFEDFAPTSTRPSAPLSASFHPAEADAINFRYGAVLAVGDLEGNGSIEVVLAAPHGPQTGGAALVIADYDTTKKIFVARPEQPFTAALGVDAELGLVDVDGDGHLDAVLTTGTAEAPGDLLLLFGDGLGGLSTDAPVIVRPASRGVRSAAWFRPRFGAGHALLVAGEEGMFLVRFGPDRSVDVEPAPGLPFAKAVSIGDFDDDGLEDVLLLAEDGVELFLSIPVLR